MLVFSFICLKFDGYTFLKPVAVSFVVNKGVGTCIQYLQQSLRHAAIRKQSDLQNKGSSHVGCYMQLM